MSQKFSIPSLDIKSFSPEIPEHLFDKYREVNRLIIIGNGFDIAHGLKSSYQDFIHDYCIRVITQLVHSLAYKDFFLEISAPATFSDASGYVLKLTGEQALNQLMKLEQHSSGIKVLWKSDFFFNTLTEVHIKKWVDIEVLYYDHLKDLVSKKKEKEIASLNQSFDFLRDLTTNYLIKISNEVKIPIDNGIQEQFEEKIQRRDCESGTIETDMDPCSVCILNFNYTQVAQHYLKFFDKSDWQHISIHGQLEGDDIKNQSPIFGYGDELDEGYKEFEAGSNDLTLTHLKSFKYLEFSNYRRLIEFIEAKPYQIQIFGHSCGLSDRTLLNTVFENSNCISIKSFYYKWGNGDDFVQRGYAISRTFKSKASLRAKVVNKEFCQPMSQPRN